MGMVGGGEGAFIGVVHRMAAAMHGEIDLVCAALSADAERAMRSGALLNSETARIYPGWQQMLASECELPPQQRMEFVAIVTPNHLHYPVAEAALRSGFHVLSDKPAARSLAEAKRLQRAVAQSARLYALTHTYAAYPLIDEARARVLRGDIGTLRRVAVEYIQGWLAQHDPANRQAAWRLDPERAGVSCCLSDIGTHAFNLLEYVSGTRVESVLADVRRVVPGRALDDDAAMLLRLSGGGAGTLTASQVCAGEHNALTLRLFGENGTLEWRQQEPNSLHLRWRDAPEEILRTGSAWLSDATRRDCNFPAGHPEGYLEAFANIYRRFAAAVRRYPDIDPIREPLQGIAAGVRALAFVEAALSSSVTGVWHPLAV